MSPQKVPSSDSYAQNKKTASDRGRLTELAAWSTRTASHALPASGRRHQVATSRRRIAPQV